MRAEGLFVNLRNLLSLSVFAAALPTFAASLSFTGGCTSSEPGLTSTIDFGPQNAPNTTDPAGHATYNTSDFGSQDPGCGGAWLDQSFATTTILFDAPISYFGFAWGTTDSYNSVSVYNGSTLLSTFFGSAGGASAPTVYANIFAGVGEQITKIEMGSAGCCFETDNHSYILATESGQVPEPSSLVLVLAAAAAEFARRAVKARNESGLSF